MLRGLLSGRFLEVHVLVYLLFCVHNYSMEGIWGQIRYLTLQQKGNVTDLK